MRFGPVRTTCLAVAWLGFIAALCLPCIDNDAGGDFLRGFDVRGWRCFIAVWCMPLVKPLATPLWLVLGAGNLNLIAGAPVLAALAAPGGRRLRWVRTLAGLAAGGILLLYFSGDSLGLRKLHLGYFLWSSSHLLFALAVLWPLAIRD